MTQYREVRPSSRVSFKLRNNRRRGGVRAFCSFWEPRAASKRFWEFGSVGGCRISSSGACEQGFGLRYKFERNSSWEIHDEQDRLSPFIGRSFAVSSGSRGADRAGRR